MRQDDGEGDGDQRDGEGVDNGLVEREDSGQQEQENFVAIYEHPGGLRSEKADHPWKESYKCDGIGESSGGHGEMGHRGDGSNGENGDRGERNRSSSIGGEKMVGSRIDEEKMMGHRGEGSNGDRGEGSIIGGEKMMGTENVRLKLALVECRLLLHDQVIKGDNSDNDAGQWSSESEDVFEGKPAVSEVRGGCPSCHNPKY